MRNTEQFWECFVSGVEEKSSRSVKVIVRLFGKRVFRSIGAAS
jgi:hypothetical protein